MPQLIFFIIFIILLQLLSKTLEKRLPPEEEEEGPVIFPPFPVPEEEERQLEKIRPKVKEIKKELPLSPKRQKPLKEPAHIPSPYAEEEKIPLLLPRDKLEEGIILSVILGPPKALQRRQGDGTGLRATLKKWCP